MSGRGTAGTVVLQIGDMGEADGPCHVHGKPGVQLTVQKLSSAQPPFSCFAIWWDSELSVASSRSPEESRELSPGISPGILIRGFSQSQLGSRAGIFPNMLAFVSI